MRDELQKIIIRALKNDKCVIVIGPDFKEFPEKSFFGAMKAYFLQYGGKYSKDIFFQTEEFIEPKKDEDVPLIQGMINSFYEQQTAFDEPLTKLSRIPFSLIISLMPDTRLETIFKSQNFSYEFKYYPVNGKRADIAERSTKDSPLIYNLLGNLSDYNAVFSFDTMFDFLGNLFHEELPKGVQLTLKESWVFIFWGVRFEKWHTQLVLKAIANQQTNEKSYYYTTDIHNGEDEVIVFIMDRLKLSATDDVPETFMRELYDACQKENILRKAPPKVFISYNHNDREAALAIVTFLKSKYVEVIIDIEKMKRTQKIIDFTNTIAEVDFVVPVISKNSLFSPYVFQEINAAISLGKKLYPCVLDKMLFSDDLTERAKEQVDSKLQAILKDYERRIAAGAVNHVASENKLWADYWVFFSIVIDELTARSNNPINLEDIPRVMQELIDDWNSAK